jgi:hypothetical protein
MYNNKPIKLGSGFTTRYISLKITPTTSQTITDISSLLVDHIEFTNYCQRYEFVRIAGLQIIIPPNNNNGELLILPKWTTSSVTGSELENNDTTKYVPIFTTRTKKRTIVPPDIPSTVADIESATTTYSTVMIKRYNPTDIIYYKAGTTTYKVNFPLRLVTKLTNQVSDLNIKFVLKCKFYGEKFNDNLTKLRKYLNDPIILDRMKVLDNINHNLPDKSFDIINESISSIKTESNKTFSNQSNKIDLNDSDFKEKFKDFVPIDEKFFDVYNVLCYYFDHINDPNQLKYLIDYLKPYYLQKEEYDIYLRIKRKMYDVIVPKEKLKPKIKKQPPQPDPNSRRTLEKQAKQHAVTFDLKEEEEKKRIDRGYEKSEKETEFAINEVIKGFDTLDRMSKSFEKKDDLEKELKKLEEERSNLLDLQSRMGSTETIEEKLLENNNAIVKIKQKMYNHDKRMLMGKRKKKK